jgi:hypothetical protein
MIYNCTPPELGKTNIEKEIEYHWKIIRETNPEYVGIYDIIEEKSRNGRERPYHHRPHMNSYIFAEILRNKIPDTSFIVYRSVKLDDTYDSIVSDIKSHQDIFKQIVIVGNSRNRDIVTSELIVYVLQECDVKVGCVLLPERPNEIAICEERIRLGVTFFISQIIADYTIIQPFLEQLSSVRIWTTIIPIENEKTVEMYNWLNGTNHTVDLTTYPEALVTAQITDICFETISYIHSVQIFLIIPYKSYYGI